MLEKFIFNYRLPNVMKIERRVSGKRYSSFFTHEIMQDA